MVICVHPIFKFISGVSAMTTAKPQFDREKILKEESAFFPDDHEAHMITHSKAATEKEGFSLNLEQPLDRINQDIVQHVLNSCNGNQTAAAKKLGISRTTLWRYINR